MSSDSKKEYSNKDVSAIVTDIFANANLHILAGFLLIYLVVFVGFGSYMKNKGSGDYESTVRSTFDGLFFTCVLVFLAYKYITQPSEDSTYMINNFTDKIIEMYDNELALFSIMLFVVSFYLLLMLLQVPLKESKPMSVIFIEGISWFLLGTLVIHNSLKYFFEIDLLENLRNNDLQNYLDPDNANEQLDASGNPIEEVEKPSEEVFNISNNLYNYEDAQAICRAYDSRLATYDEIETAYENGAEWCNYGWSADQMAFFPTQKNTWEELQHSQKHKNSCGRPGINGGYFRNPNIKFGVNCYGVKPEPKENDLKMMETKKNRPYPRTEEEKLMDEKVNYWKEHAHDMLRVNSYNRDKWSRY